MKSVRLSSLHRIVCVVALTTTLAAVAFAQAAQSAPEKFDVRAHYIKLEQQIVMRDGVKLFATIYLPKDTSQKYPILMVRTPYGVGPYGADAYKDSLHPSAQMMKEGFIFVFEDVRGRNLSEGVFQWMPPYKPGKSGPTDVDESTDTYDTIDWLIKNLPNNNGRVGMWGISYPGHFTAQALIDAHPALKAASPQAPMADNYLGDDMHHNGTFFLSHAFNFLIRSDFGLQRSAPAPAQRSGFTHGTPDGYRFFLEMGSLANANKYFKGQNQFWNLWMEHGDYDEYWKAQNVPQHLNNVRPAVMTVGGWFDAEDLPGPLVIYQAIEKKNPQAKNTLVMGPWCHGCWARGTGASLGNVSFGSSTSEFYQANIELPFFNFYLKDKGELKLPEAYVFETGSNQWRQYEQWPPREAQPMSLYLQPGGKLGTSAPPESKNAFDEYISDPHKPVPFITDITNSMSYAYMTDDQRFAASRPDVLVYEGDALTEDLTIAGPVKVELFVSTSGTDSDFVVKLIDVFPGNIEGRSLKNVPLGHYQMLVRGEPFRAKYRNGFDKPAPMKPNQVTPVTFEMPDINHTFQKGHRLMVQIQSTWFPLADRNPQKFMNIYKATEADFQKATQRVYRAGKNSTRLTVQVLKKTMSAEK